MKKLLLIGLTVVGLTLSSSALSVFSTNITTGAAQGGFLLLSGRVNVKQIQLSTTVSSGVLVAFYDANVMTSPLWGTNFTNAAYTTVNSYATNFLGTNGVTSYVGMNGITNYVTNVGVFTYTSTVAYATNVLPQQAALVAIPNTLNVSDQDFLVTKGLVVTATTNCSMVIYYTTVQ